MTFNNISDILFTPRFNPCFGGSYIVTSPLISSLLIFDKFQSLFWWILYCDLYARGLK